MSTVQDFYRSAGQQTNFGGTAWYLPDGSMTTDVNVYANTPNPLYGGKTPAQHLQQLQVNPADMTAPVPDPLKGSLMPTGNDLAGMMLAFAPMAAMVGGAAGVGGLSNAGWGAGVGESVSGAYGATTGELGNAAASYGAGGATGGFPAGSFNVADSAGVTDFGSSGYFSGGENVYNPGGESVSGNYAPASGELANAAASYGSSPTSLSQWLSQQTGIPQWGIDAAGRALPGLAGAYASNQQTNAMTGLANKYAEMGAPYRQRLSDLYSNPSSFLSSQEVQVPVQQGTDALARSLSAKVGNPIDNMSALGELQNYSANQLFGRLGQEKDRLAGYGGLSSYNQAAPGLEQSALASGSNFWNSLGAAASNVFNPTPTLESLLKGLQGNNIFRYGP